MMAGIYGYVMLLWFVSLPLPNLSGRPTDLSLPHELTPTALTNCLARFWGSNAKRQIFKKTRKQLSEFVKVQITACAPLSLPLKDM
jgi:hypothetical protein